MSELEQRLNALMSNPQLMQQIASMAQTMGATSQQEQAVLHHPEKKTRNQLASLLKERICGGLRVSCYCHGGFFSLRKRSTSSAAQRRKRHCLPNLESSIRQIFCAERSSITRRRAVSISE